MLPFAYMLAVGSCIPDELVEPRCEEGCAPPDSSDVVGVHIFEQHPPSRVFRRRGEEEREGATPRLCANLQKLDLSETQPPPKKQDRQQHINGESEERPSTAGERDSG
eukprot:4658107-Amphidinium_carterae.1